MELPPGTGIKVLGGASADWERGFKAGWCEYDYDGDMDKKRISAIESRFGRKVRSGYTYENLVEFGIGYLEGWNSRSDAYVYSGSLPFTSYGSVPETQLKLNFP